MNVIRGFLLAGVIGVAALGAALADEKSSGDEKFTIPAADGPSGSDGGAAATDKDSAPDKDKAPDKPATKKPAGDK